MTSTETDRPVGPPSPLSLSARQQTQLIAQRALSCEALLSTTLDWIDTVNPAVNAICTLDSDAALQAARAADKRLADGAAPRPLEGLPIAIKDLAETAGLLTTYGSPLFADHVPDFSVLYVQRLQAAGAIVVGKTNVPEFGAGSQTFNTLFGTTRNPYDLDCTAGGSSGGAAAALAARMLAIADGSDLGGSLRNPAAFCNVVGFRPSPGRVPIVPDRNGYSPLPIMGPMARTVDDLGLLLSVMAGYDPRAALALQDSTAPFAQIQPAVLQGLRVAASEDLGFLPVAEPVRVCFQESLAPLSEQGVVVTPAAPDLRKAQTVFSVLRAQQFVGGYGALYRRDPDALKDTVRWNIELGLAATPEALAEATLGLASLRAQMLEFFERYDILMLPTVQVLPFAQDLDWPREVAGVAQSDYLGWMASCWLISTTGCPSISIPAGFSDGGLPIGMQLVGPPGADLTLLQVARAIESLSPHGQRVPPWGALIAAR
ncbi:MAG: amidase [Pseudomonadales bacterium]